MRLLLVFLAALHLAACGDAPRQGGGDILVIGDSVLAWNRQSEQDVGRLIGVELGRDVVNRATLGARVQSGGVAALAGLSIPRQLSSGPWNWVVMNGGANDLVSTCNCNRCDAEVDQLISATGETGAIPDLIARARSQGAKVLWAGYYDAPDSLSFAGCRPSLVELDRRVALYARANDGVFFVDIEDVLDPADADLLASELTHPSPAGSLVIARFLARAIAGVNDI